MNTSFSRMLYSISLRHEKPNEIAELEDEKRFDNPWFAHKKYSLENNLGFPARSENALPLTQKLISQLPAYTVVPTGTYAIRNTPMASFNYYGCRALILHSEDQMVLGHLLPHEDARRFISQIISDLSVDPKKVSGIVIGGYAPERIANLAREQGINITGCFQDYDCKTVYGSETHKDVILRNRDEIILITRQEMKQVSLREPIDPFLNRSVEALER